MAGVTGARAVVEMGVAFCQNAVALATAQLAQAQANLTSTQATAHGAKTVRDRTLSLERDSIVKDADRRERRSSATTGQARASAAQVALARAQLDRARLDLEHSIIRSPVDGTVISRNIDVGQAVASTLTAPTLFTIAQDLHHMQVHAAVDEADIGEVRAGEGATFTVDAFRDQAFARWCTRSELSADGAERGDLHAVALDADKPESAAPGDEGMLILIADDPGGGGINKRAPPVSRAGRGRQRRRTRPGPGVCVPQGGVVARPDQDRRLTAT
jgi:multidrug efflux pump subunit AcrA (membrane-fusion protein)